MVVNSCVNQLSGPGVADVHRSPSIRVNRDHCSEGCMTGGVWGSFSLFFSLGKIDFIGLFFRK